MLTLPYLYGSNSDSRDSAKGHGGQVFSFGLSDDIMDWESGDTIPIWHLEDQMRWRRAEQEKRGIAEGRAPQIGLSS